MVVLQLRTQQKKNREFAIKIAVTENFVKNHTQAKNIKLFWTKVASNCNM